MFPLKISLSHSAAQLRLLVFITDFDSRQHGNRLNDHLQNRIRNSLCGHNSSVVVHGVRPFFKSTTPEKSFVTLNKMVRHKLDWELVCRLYNQRSVSKYILNYWEY